MASSKAMTSTSPANQELPRQSSSLHLLTHIHSKNFTSINMDDLLHNIYSDSNHFPADQTVGESSAAADQPPITLEDFLAKAGAITEEDVKAVVESEQAVFPAPAAADDMMNGGGVIAYPDAAAAQGFDRRIAVRGKRRAVEVVDKKTQQKQRRMIKNRESAARSRERKQAYTAELESMVMQLEEENARLLQEEAEQTKKRFKQLMESLIPVVEKKRPPRVLRRVLSM